MLLKNHNNRVPENLSTLKEVFKKVTKLHQDITNGIRDIDNEQIYGAIDNFILLKAYIYIVEYHLWRLELLKKIRYVLEQDSSLYSKDSIEHTQYNQNIVFIQKDLDYSYKRKKIFIKKVNALKDIL